jgi:hypothetical protein
MHPTPPNSNLPTLGFLFPQVAQAWGLDLELPLVVELLGVFSHEDPAAAAVVTSRYHGPRSRVHQKKGNCDDPKRLSIAPQLQLILDRILLGQTLEFEEGISGHRQGAALAQLAADFRAAGTRDGTLAASAQAEAGLVRTSSGPTDIWLSGKGGMAAVVDGAGDAHDFCHSSAENRLVAAMCELHRRMLDAWQHCAICDGLLPSGGDWRRRPMVCGRELCRFQLVQLGLGAGCTDRVDTWDKVV